MALSPTPPQPMTATVSPTSTGAVRNTAPQPGHSPAADNRRYVTGNSVRYDYGRVLMHQEILGKGTQRPKGEAALATNCNTGGWDDGR
jgi:hypothetical protein